MPGLRVLLLIGTQRGAALRLQGGFLLSNR